MKHMPVEQIVEELEIILASPKVTEPERAEARCLYFKMQHLHTEDITIAEEYLMKVNPYG